MIATSTKAVPILVAAMTVEDFKPGTTFRFLNGTWRRRLFRGYLRGADCGNFRVVEQNPATGSHWARLVHRNHGAHEDCDGKNPHQIYWVFEGNKYIARVIDGRWEDLA